MTTTYTVRLPDGATFGPAGMDLLVRWASEGRLGPDSVLIPSDGTAELAAGDVPELRQFVMAPPIVRGVVPEPPDDAVSGLIPYRNGPALAGYYAGIGSLIPFVGLALGPAAIVLGVMGLRKYKREPRVKGGAHAWAAVVLGVIGLVLWPSIVLTAALLRP
jgi:hypothetical protein